MSDLNRRYNEGELTGLTEAVQDSSEIYYTNSGHPVFGGGGKFSRGMGGIRSSSCMTPPPPAPCVFLCMENH